jgi:GTP-binding protein
MINHQAREIIPNESEIMTEQLLRNIAIIAHVDHGKTTLVDAMLRQTHTFRANQTVAERVMDSLDLEREKGITIKAKNASVQYKDVKINLIDTPGHADFGGEVERVLRMVDGVLLLVDAVDGPMPQTRFVLRKALQLGLHAIVVINKIDMPEARPHEVAEKTFELFLDLGARDEQLNFPIVYTIALQGTATLDLQQAGTDLTPLFEAILKALPPPNARPNDPAQLLVLALDYNPYQGRIGIGKLESGNLKKGQRIAQINSNGAQETWMITELAVYHGLNREPVDEVCAGEIVAIAGIENVSIGDTVCEVESPVSLGPVVIDEPTLQMTFGVNTSPFAGREGQAITSRILRERLFKETETNVSLRVSPTESPDRFLIAGRGVLHLAILIETMRREGYEFDVSPPQVVFKRDDSGRLLEPFETVSIEVPVRFSGAIMEELGSRQAIWQHQETTTHGEVFYTFLVSTRQLIGLKNLLLSRTNGTVVFHHRFDSYRPASGESMSNKHGSLVSMAQGKTTAYSLNRIQERGTLFVGPGVEVYQGQVVGRCARDTDLEVNPTKGKQLTNIRAAGADEMIVLTPPLVMSLEGALEYIGPDERLEVTPQSLRLRKRYLARSERERQANPSLVAQPV